MFEAKSGKSVDHSGSRVAQGEFSRMHAHSQRMKELPIYEPGLRLSSKCYTHLDVDGLALDVSQSSAAVSSQGPELAA